MGTRSVSIRRCQQGVRPTRYPVGPLTGDAAATTGQPGPDRAEEARSRTCTSTVRLHQGGRGEAPRRPRATRRGLRGPGRLAREGRGRASRGCQPLHHQALRREALVKPETSAQAIKVSSVVQVSTEALTDGGDGVTWGPCLARPHRFPPEGRGEAAGPPRRARAERRATADPVPLTLDA